LRVVWFLLGAIFSATRLELLTSSRNNVNYTNNCVTFFGGNEANLAIINFK